MTIRFPVDGDAVEGETFKYQNQLPKLPIPDLNDTAKRYLDALKPLQTSEEHEVTKKAVQEFLVNEGPKLQERLKTYATDKSSYIEEFW
ncbi:Putative Carnitine O-acetyltransferase [Rhizopus microsporus]|nr:Putative Carnitine O-acetyltransferase [Rhizopus microsporus]